ncbi:MAG: anti-sigma factor family protein [Candidatus Aminicenantales bacterium]
MLCWRFEKLISDHLDGRLSPRKEERLQRHLRSCSRCQAYLEDLKIIQAKTPSPLPFHVPESYWQDSLALLRNKLIAESSKSLQAEKNKWLKARRWRLGWALVALGAAVLIIYLLFPKPPVSQPEVFASAETLPLLIDQLESDVSFLDAFNETIEAEIRSLANLEENYMIYLENPTLLLENLSDEEIDLLLIEIQKERGVEGL